MERGTWDFGIIENSLKRRLRCGKIVKSVGVNSGKKRE